MRQKAYYWVSLCVEEDDGDGLIIVWEVAHWDGSYWSRPGDDCCYDDNEFEEIDETPITR